MLDFNEFVRDRLDRQTDEEIAREVLAGNVDLWQIVLDEVKHVRRHRTRAAEAAAFRRSPSGNSGGGGGSVVSQRQQLAEDSFPLGDGRWVKWTEATIADHQQRIEMLVKMRGGLNETIARHQSVVDACVEHGVDCWADLPAGVDVEVAA